MALRLGRPKRDRMTQAVSCHGLNTVQNWHRYCFSGKVCGLTNPEIVRIWGLSAWTAPHVSSDCFRAGLCGMEVGPPGRRQGPGSPGLGGCGHSIT